MTVSLVLVVVSSTLALVPVEDGVVGVDTSTFKTVEPTLVSTVPSTTRTASVKAVSLGTTKITEECGKKTEESSDEVEKIK